MVGSLKDFHDDFKAELFIFIFSLVVVLMNMLMYSHVGDTNLAWIP